MGNMTVSDQRNPEEYDRTIGANLTNLNERFRTSKYLVGHSDIVALMVLEHQTKMHNLITLANYEGRLALRDEVLLAKMLKEPSAERLPSIQRRFDHSAERLLKYMLFVDEARLAEPIRGTSGFAEEFAEKGPRDSKQRSLRDFDLQTRMFKFPCSSLVYSEAFDSLPTPVRDSLYRQLFDVLTGKNSSAGFAHLSAADRAAILDILRETKPGLPEYWATTTP
jgi:hypothetical protein